MSATRMSKRLSGRTILITGASSGMGRATALEFARTSPSNLKLILAARRLERVQELAEEIKKEVGDGVKCWPVKLDVSKKEDIDRFVGEVKKNSEFKDVDCLINNAGVALGVAQAPNIDPKDIQLMMDTNVFGLVHMTQAIMPIFQSHGPPEDKGHGDIVNIGSIAGREGYPGGGIYCASKAAIRAFTEAMRKELISSRIRIMEIDPGQVETEFSVIRFGGDKDKADAVYKGVEPLTGDDIAEIIVFLVGRRENVVIADTLVFPNHQASAQVMHRKS